MRNFLWDTLYITTEFFRLLSGTIWDTVKFFSSLRQYWIVPITVNHKEIVGVKIIKWIILHFALSLFICQVITLITFNLLDFLSSLMALHPSGVRTVGDLNPAYSDYKLNCLSGHNIRSLLNFIEFLNLDKLNHVLHVNERIFDLVTFSYTEMCQA